MVVVLTPFENSWKHFASQPKETENSVRGHKSVNRHDSERGDRDLVIEQKGKSPHRESRQAGSQADREEEKKDSCDNVTPMDMNMMMNCVARFKSNPVVVFDVHPSKSAGIGSNISPFNHLTHTHSPAAGCNPKLLLLLKHTEAERD